MTITFDAPWLTLREPADIRARNGDLAEALAARFALRDSVRVVDIGCGTGANLRATASLLPAQQSWTLIDNDDALLSAAAKALSSWADSARSDGGVLAITKGRADIKVAFRKLDLSVDIEAAFDSNPDLVTASAFFDLVSEDFVRTFARIGSERRAVFYAVLTYNGVQRWVPHRPQDNQMTAAFHRHQMRDKGFGAALGPLAATHLADQFRMSGYSVLEGESPWILERDDRMLIEELARGHVMAVSETGSVDGKTIEAWVKVMRTGAMVGHTDTLAIPT